MKRIAPSLLLLLAMSAARAVAQDIPHIHKQNLQAIDYPAGHRTLMIRTTIDPHSLMPPHTHPGIEAGYVLEGSALVRLVGRADQTVNAGHGFIIPPHMIHSVLNTGGAPLVVLTNYVVEAGKPVIDLVKK